MKIEKSKLSDKQFEAMVKVVEAADEWSSVSLLFEPFKWKDACAKLAKALRILRESE